jgi:hypothetical protein
LLIGEAKFGTVRASVFAEAAYQPQRLFWIADPTTMDKPFARKVAAVGLFHRSKQVTGRATHLKRQCLVFTAHLYRPGAQESWPWSSLLVGALLYVKGKTIPALVG